MGFGVPMVGINIYMCVCVLNTYVSYVERDTHFHISISILLLLFLFLRLKKET